MEELTAIIALSRVKGLDRVQKKQIVEKLDQVAPLFEGRPAFLDEATGRKISAFKAWKEIDSELVRLQRMNAEVVTIKDRAYPGALKNIPDPPLVLYKKGALPAGEHTFAIVGSRRATSEGMHISEKIAETLSTLGVTVASGLARGIDASAHRGALKGAGKTIAVLGCGLDICYPAENKRLFDRIGEEGAILTEYSLGLQPLARNFPERNRIIAGLSKGILVVEAAERSGSLITARLGAEYGKDVMAIPGSIFDNGYKGANALIKEGAKLIDSVEDIISECFPDLRLYKEQPIDMNSNEDYIYSIMGMGKIHIDEVIEKSRMATKEVMAILTMLEMKEAIQELAGGFYIKK
ncbi:MAG: DNA-protecting protein DprA [Syntrophus sp. (in: bacteria)]|nr:DNA-protecting protein DprA [Syntrophus sp. (in: bacteria)]